ncbi:gamma-glutamylcyclotransferase family protein [Portibacter marinus]|uniref:gamma-glutamylcyclotransferase family protein n=1 Tax=Portibacter marinus TaxID=2898660 RepID=UPI001F48BF09|nr:gamma-glutamylcyclotransferase family protein [Portibacter marinus]
MPVNLFVYGTLMDAETWSYFTTKTYHSTSFVLKGYVKKRIKDRPYPGIIVHPDSFVEGILYANVEEDDIYRLDEYEGDEYDRIILTQDGMDIETYLFTGDVRLLH